MEIIVNSGSGIETATKLELRDLGIDAPCLNGKFAFHGGTEEIVKCNLYLRTADRVSVRLAKFTATTFDMLFDNVKEIPWEDIIAADGAIIVNAKSVDSKLFALSAIQSITKKAIVVRLHNKYKNLPENGAPYLLEINIYKDEVSVLLDTSGDGLHKRGYRDLVWEAPIKETIAAAILKLSVWNADRPLIDPFCGSGTIPIEAAMAALHIAPGLKRNFSYENYFFMDKDITAKERRLAEDAVIKDKKLRISGFDINPKAISLAVRHAKNAGVEGQIHFETSDMRNVSSRYKYGVIVTNPPYGERLLEERELTVLYKDFGKMYRSLDGWSLYAITSYPAFEKYFGGRVEKTRKMYNARLECRMYCYLGPKPPVKDNIPKEDAETTD